MTVSFQSGFPSYEIEEEVGCGNLTIVYRARRREDDQLVSIKVVTPEFASDPIFVRRFIEAAGRAIRLDHPNIARVHEAAEHEDVVYVVREYLETDTLADWLEREGSMSPGQAVPVIRQLASALDYAHSRRLMHGDINDRCVYIGDDGHVTLADFGLSQAVASSDVERSSGSRSVKMVAGMGASAYLAPERVQGQGPTRPADIYALGVLAYQVLAGHVPFSGEIESVLEAQVYQTPPLLHTINPDVLPPLSAAVARALSKRPELRYSTATEFSRAFAAAAEGIAPSRGPATGAHPKSRKPRGRPSTWVIVTMVIIGLVLAGVLWGAAGWGQRLVTQISELMPLSGPPPEETAPIPPVATSPAPTATTSPPTAVLTPSTSTLVAEQPTLPPISTLIPQTVAEGSPFSSLVLARGIDENSQPVSPGSQFPTGDQPVYLFFDYENIEPGSRWGHVWMRGREEMGRTMSTWPAGWGTVGTGWVYYAPGDDYQPGPYEVRLLVDDEVVASVTFIVQ
jgi:serine/threonine protein kinase